MSIQQAIACGDTALGIELGSTRIKAVLVGPDHTPIATGGFDWENRYEGGVWTYHLDEVWAGLRACYQRLCDDALARYGAPVERVGAIGVSGMMHGYLALDAAGRQLAPFRTWRNTTTAPAAERLTELLQFSIPQRWSVAHLYQAILNGEPHVGAIAQLTTLAGYVHWRLTGERVLGVGEASGMFPIDSAACDYDAHMLALLEAQPELARQPWRLREILPRVLPAGAPAGALSAEGALLLDPSGRLRAGAPLCPPEGDAGTGMVATNCVAERTANISAGTSVFAMVVLERPLAQRSPDIDMVTTPAGRPVAMVHTNNGTTDLNDWVALFQEFAGALGRPVELPELYALLYQSALGGDADAGGLLAYNYLSGEHITHMAEGRPLIVRGPTSRLTLANLMRAHLFAALGALRIGLDTLLERERVQIDRILGHGGFFKTAEVGQRIMAAALGAPVAVLETAGEGGAWGIALLAAYMLRRAEGEPLERYLDERVFASQRSAAVAPDPRDQAGFAAFMERYRRGLPIERAAVAALR